MAFLRQIVVTLVILLAMLAVYIKFEPAAGRALLALDLPAQALIRSAVLWIAPEAGEPETADASSGRGGRGRFGGGGATLVVTDPVEISRTRTEMHAIGTGEAARSVTVYPDNTTGIIVTVGVRSGQAVAAGDVLVELERSTEELAVDRARIALEAAEAKLERYQRLARSRTITAVEVEDVVRERDNARFDLRSAQIALDKRTIKAPIDGRVGIVSVDQGDLVNSQTAIATIDDRSRLKVIFYTPESFVSELSVGRPVEAVSTAQPDRAYRGEISAIDSRLDEASRTLRTEALIENSGDTLRPGMSFTVSLSLDGDEYLSVDPISVVWERSGPIVWKVVDGQATKAPVRIVERNIDRVLIASEDLEPGDAVVVEGLQSMRPGISVRTLDDEESEDSAPVAERPTGAAPSEDPRSERASSDDTTEVQQSASSGIVVGTAVAEEIGNSTPGLSSRDAKTNDAGTGTVQ